MSEPTKVLLTNVDSGKTTVQTVANKGLLNKEAAAVVGAVIIGLTTLLDVSSQDGANWRTAASAVIIASGAALVRSKVWSNNTVLQILDGVFKCENCDSADTSQNSDSDQPSLDDELAAITDAETTEGTDPSEGSEGD